MKPVEITSFLEFQLVSNPGFSPDGQYAAFVVQQASLEDNSYKGDLWILDVRSKQSRRLTTGGDAKNYVWKPEGTLLFSAARDTELKKRRADGERVTGYYEIDPDGGEAKLAFVIPAAAKKICPAGGERYVVAVDFDNNEPDLSSMDAEERKKTLEARKNPPYEVFEEAPFWANGSGITNGKRQRLYLYTKSDGEMKPLTGPWFQTTDFSIHGNMLYYTGVEWRGFRDPESLPGFWCMDLETGEQSCLMPENKWKVSAYTPWRNGAVLAAATDCCNCGFYQYPDFVVLEPDCAEWKKLASYEASVGHGSVGTDSRLGGGRGSKLSDGKFYFISTEDDSTYLRCIDENGVISDTLTPWGSCDSFDVAGGRVLTCGLFGNKLAELYLDGEQVTFFNDAWTAGHSIVVPEPHSFLDPDGFEVRGWAMKPAGYTEGKKYPAILHIHGGPRTVFGTIYHHEMQLWANAGYFVFYCNPRGSDGRGNAFGDITGKYGTVDYENLMQFADEMLLKYLDADQSRFGVAGGSYGGFMTNWIIGHTDRFAAAVSQRSISNWISFEHTSDIGPRFVRDNPGANTRDNVGKLWWHSPLKYADRCKTPTLFIHSDADYRCWLAEGISMFTAVKMHGCEARMCVFKGENHDLSRSGKPRNRIRRMEEILNWMDRYLK